MTHLTHLGSEFRNEFLENFKLNNYRNTKEQNPFYEHKEQRLAKECPSKNICIHLNICGKNMVLFTFKIRKLLFKIKRREIYFGYNFTCKLKYSTHLVYTYNYFISTRTAANYIK